MVEKKEDKKVTEDRIKTLVDYFEKYRKTNKLEDLIKKIISSGYSQEDVNKALAMLGLREPNTEKKEEPEINKETAIKGEKGKEEKIEKIRKEAEKEIVKTKIHEGRKIEIRKKIIFIGVFLGLIAFTLLLLVYKKLITAFVGFAVVAGLFFVYIYLKSRSRKNEKIRKIESSFPDFLQLMASNLRAGMTVDRAMLLSSRPEFAPLDKEILNVGKDIATGRSIETALLDMSKRIKSEKVEKTILLIISGIRSGGDLAILLEQTATRMREKEFIEKKAASNILMYNIFVFIAASFGAPVLFSLSTLLVETLSNTLTNMPSVDATYTNLPIALSSINVSVNFIKYFSLFFIVVTDVLAALVLGLVSKGEEREGFKYIIPMLVISLSIFFIIRIVLSGFTRGIMGG